MKLNTITSKLRLITIVLFLFLSISIAVSYTFRTKQRGVANAIDVSGRNRMLSQRMAFLSERIYDGEQELSSELQTLIDQHQDALVTLKQGGKLKNDNVRETLSPPPQEVLPSIYEAEKNWELYKKSVLAFTQPNTATEAQLLVVEDLSLQMLTSNEQIVLALVKYSNLLQTQLQIILFSILVIGLCLISAIFMVLRSVSSRLTKLSQSASNVLGNNFSTRIHFSGNDEIALLAKSFDHTTQKIKEAYGELENKLKERTHTLEETLKDSQKNNTELEKTKVAMLNVFEDFNEEKIKLEEKDRELIEAQKVGRFGTFTWDITNNKVMWSDEAFHLHGFKPTTNHAPPPIKKYFSSIHPDDRKEAEASMQKALKEKGEQEHYYRVLLEDDSDRWIKVSSEATFDEKGTATLMRGTFQDVTKEREIDKAKTEFVSLASHQLRTPLTAINWYTEILLEGDAGKITADQKANLEEIYNGSKRMVDLVNALLNVSRIELGTFAVTPEPTDLVALVRSVLDELKLLIDEKELKITEKHDKLEHIPIDPKLMRIVYQNLLTNAVKYTPEKGSLSITHTLEIKDKKQYVHIQVSDTGYGIPKNQQDKIFTKLYRASNVREKDTQGTGLGLYIVKSIITESQGEIWFESKENKGTTFHILLPITGMVKKEGSKPLESGSE